MRRGPVQTNSRNRLRITTRFRTERTLGETFQAFIKRISGEAECKKMIDDFTAIPSHDDDPSFYSDWGDPHANSPSAISASANAPAK